MTSAPDDLLEVQRYLHAQTGQDWASLGIIHSTPQGGGYHEGEDLLIRAGTAPGPQYPGSDYSYTDAPARDLLPTGRLAGGDYASAFDLGGGFTRFLEFNAWMRGRLLAGDPRTRDVREFIHTLDGRTVRRIDRTGVQPDGGDDSHLSHSHTSFFRDSVGRRSRDDNYLGLLREFFEGITQEEDDMDATQDAHLRATDSRVRRLAEGALTFDPADPDVTYRGKPIPLNVGVKQLLVDVADVKNSIAALKDRPTGEVVMSDADRARLVADVAALIPRPATAAEIAAAVLDLQAQRLKD